MQLKSQSYTNTIKNIGIKRLYTGFTITSCRNFTGVGFYFAGYEFVKHRIENPYLGSLIGGMAAGFCCWAPMYPLDNIKTQVQSDTTYKLKILDVVKKSKLGLWKGFLPCIIRSIIVNPTVFFTYELVSSTKID